MRQRVVPIQRAMLKPRVRNEPDGDSRYTTKARGLAVLTTPLLNKGTAFSAKERKGWASPACSRPSSVRWKLK